MSSSGDDDLEVELLARCRRRRARSAGRRRRSVRSPPAVAGWPRARCAGTAGRRPGPSRSSESARWAPRFVPATACTSSTITVSTPRSISRALRGEQEVERLGRRDQDVRRGAEHLPALALVGVARADADRQGRAEPGERAPQVALDVVVERLQRRDVEQPQPLPRARVEPVDPGQERRQRLARAGRRLHEDVGARRDHGPGRPPAPASGPRTPARTRSASRA